VLVSIRASKAKAETIIGQECLKQGKGKEKARQSAIERKIFMEENQNIEKKGWSWMGFFFGAFYYYNVSTK